MKQQQLGQQQQEKEQSTYVDGNVYGCDESKCVSTTSMFISSNHSYSCYGENTDMMCADGYLPRTVENETHFQYFTCCPPSFPTETNVTRHCSDPTTNFIEPVGIGESTNSSNMICEDETRPFPRQMKSDFYGNPSYICCDSEQDKTNNYLNETECVPYFSESEYREGISYNIYGNLGAMTCDFPDGSFQFRRNVVVGKGVDTNGYLPDTKGNFKWECCKTGPAALPFVVDTTFKITVYPTIVLSSIAVFSCLIIIVGLLIPLFSEWKQKRVVGTNSNQRKTGQKKQKYSAYNLYLVYLTLPDLFLNLYLLDLYGSYANQKFTQKFYMVIVSTLSDPDDMHILKSHEGSLIVACSTANLFLNAVVSYEVFGLLRDCHQTKVNSPPSLKKVTLQATAVYIFATIVFSIHFFKSSLSDTATWCFFSVTYFLPIGFVICVAVTIWARGFIPSATGRMKELTFYFLRIVVIFCVIWIPGSLLLFLGQYNDDLFYRVYAIYFLCCAIESILSNCMVLTKSDVRKYIFDLITFSYIRSTNSEEEDYGSTSSGQKE